MSSFSALKFSTSVWKEGQIVDKLQRTTVDTLQPLPKLSVSAQHTGKLCRTIPEIYAIKTLKINLHQKHCCAIIT